MWLVAKQVKQNIFILCIAVFFAAHSVFAQEDKANKAAEAKPEPTLEQLSNAELIRQASEIFNTAEKDFLEKKRGVFIVGADYRQKQLDRRNFKLPTINTQEQSESELSLLEQAEQQFQSHQAYHTAMQQLTAWVDTEEKLLEKKIALNEATQKAGDTLLATVRQLDITHSLEMDLRYQDGTLSVNSVPKQLQKAHVEEMIQTMPSIQADLRILMLADVDQLKALKAYKKQITRSLETAKTKLEVSKQTYEQIAQQQALEKKYAGKTAEEMQAILNKLQKERIWLQGSLNLSLHKFSEREQQSQTAQQAIAALGEAQEPPASTDALDAEEATRMVDTTKGIIQYHQQRLSQLNTWHEAIKEMSGLGKSLQADLQLQSEQLLTMQFLARKLDDLAADNPQPDSTTTADNAVNVSVENESVVADSNASDAETDNQAANNPAAEENTAANNAVETDNPETTELAADAAETIDSGVVSAAENNVAQDGSAASTPDETHTEEASDTVVDNSLVDSGAANASEENSPTPIDNTSASSELADTSTAGSSEPDDSQANNPSVDYAKLEQSLGEAIGQTNQQLLDVSNKSEINQQQSDEVAEQASDAEQDVAKYQQLLTDLEKTVAILQKTEQYSKQLVALDAQQVVERFTANEQALADAKKEQANLHTFMLQAASLADTAKAKLFALKDPLMRAAEASSSTQKSQIRHSLYELAGLKESDAKPVEANTVGAGLDPEPKDLSKKIQFYGNLLTNRVRILENREQQRQALLEALKAQKQAQEKYVEQFSVIQQLLLERFASAVELRKRLGQAELDGSAVPEGTTQALQRGDLSKIDEERAAFSHAVNQTQQDIDHFGGTGGLKTDIVERLSNIQTLSSKRLDLLNDINVLQTSLKAAKKLTEAEEKTQQQTALRRLESESTPYEMILSFMPSESAESIEELLQSYYVELLQLESQQENLHKQTEHTGELVKLAGDETKSIEQLIPVLSNHLSEQTQHRDALLALVQAQLVEHEQADEILDEYFKKTGERLTEPHRLPDEDKAQAIESATEILFEWHVQLTAINDWINLLKQRAGSAGLGQESSYYNDSMAKLNSQQASIKRRIGNLTGHSAEELAALPEAEIPQNEEEKRSFLLGGIGIARENLRDLRTQGALVVIFKIIGILVGTFILLWLLNRLINRTVNRIKETDPDNQHALLAWAAIRSILKIAIIVTAFVMILSSFGVQVGAVLAGLGIGGLAVAMAAKESLANILAGVMIFLEKPFKVGDEIQIGDSEVAQVRGIGWRSTCVVTQFGYTIHIPNSQVSETTVTNYTKLEVTGDYVSVLVPQEYNPEHIQRLLDEALSHCPSIKQNDEKGTLVVGVQVIYDNAWMEYQPCWFTDDYHRRDQERKEVWSQIWRVFTENGIKFQQSGADNSGSSATMTNVSKLLDKVGVTLTASSESKDVAPPKLK